MNQPTPVSSEVAITRLQSLANRLEVTASSFKLLRQVQRHNFEDKVHELREHDNEEYKETLRRQMQQILDSVKLLTSRLLCVEEELRCLNFAKSMHIARQMQPKFLSNVGVLQFDPSAIVEHQRGSC